MREKWKKTCARFLCMLMCAVMCVGMLPAHAAESVSRYDFSSVDALDAYDQYKKETSTGDPKDILDEGIEYVLAANHNNVNTFQDLPLGYSRYGAFLRNSDDEQNYMLYNMDYMGDGTIPQNVLTIYADPGVNFKLVDLDHNQIVTEKGVSMSGKVNYYNKTTDNGHNVYYIEMKPDDISVCRQMLTFTTVSTGAQPHYSFWYGDPLVEEKTVNSSAFSVQVKNPNRSSSAVSVSATGGIPAQRAWLKTLVVKQLSVTSPANVGTVSLSVTKPDGTRFSVNKVIPTNGADLEFNANPTGSSSSLARGTYKFQLVSVSWPYGSTSNATYSFMGQMVITYLVAFGA